METFMNNLCIFASDRYLFPIVQGMFILFALFAVIRDIRARLRANRSSGAKLRLKRGPQSMAKFHGAYVAMAFLIVLVTLNVKVLEGYRISFVILNIGLLLYLCFWNAWFRNKLMGWIEKSSDAENF